MAQKLRKLKVKTKQKGGKITTAGRRSLKRSDYALPGASDRPGIKGKYPIDTIKRARNALARVAQVGTPYEIRKVRAAVKKKYPSIGKKKKQK